MATRKWKNEFLVNTTTAGVQDQSSVTALADGGFVITWRDDGPADSLIRWQRYDAAGVKLGVEQTIADTIGDQSLPDVVQLSDGNLWFTAEDFNTFTDDEIQGWVYTSTGAFVRFQQPEANNLAQHQDASSASLGQNSLCQSASKSLCQDSMCFVSASNCRPCRSRCNATLSGAASG